MSAETDFVEALIAKQRERGVGTREFARVLGVSASQWSLVSRGKRNVSLAFARRAVTAFPELTARALFLLQPGSTVSNASVR